MATLTEHKLAVVIPAYKSDFLAGALESLVRQTDQRFSIYVCDDASPSNIGTVTRSVLGERAYVFERFEHNLGRTSLVKQWNRCVALTREPWIWLFSDDDLMDPDCVKAFYQFLESEGETAADILRFDSWIADENDKITGLHTLNVDSESWLEFTYGRLMGWRRSYMQQLIFRRSTLEKLGGFLELPLAWYTDDAAVLAMGLQKKIRRIPGPRVYWRRSRKNISSDRTFKARKNKLRAVCLFLQWVRNQLRAPREHLFEGDDAAFLSAMDRFLVEQIGIEGALPALANWNLLSRTRVQICRGSGTSLVRYIVIAGLNDSMSSLGRLAKMLVGSSDT
jgi:glycosyltransferase involved in cell wall biosynthesis